MSNIKAAIIGSGNIGTDLMIKIMRLSDALEVAAFVGIDPDSDGLARAGRLGIPTISTGIDGMINDSGFADIQVVFDATSARAHVANAAKLADFDVRLIDLTPAAIGPYVVPAVNLETHLFERNLNMVTCGGQATIPIVAAVSSVARTPYAEIVASIASQSAGPGTRANIDEFTETTSRAIEQVGSVARGKAIIVLNPAEPPLIMRDTVFCIVEQDLLDHPGRAERMVVSVLLEVEGAGHYLPPYAGNLDIMTSAARRVGERVVAAVGVG
jgi:acetaldehyde dehydrogenase